MIHLSLAVLLPILLIQLALLIVALLDCLRAKTTSGPKWLWILIIIFVSTLGPVLYFIFGRKNH